MNDIEGWNLESKTKSECVFKHKSGLKIHIYSSECGFDNFGGLKVLIFERIERAMEFRKKRNSHKVGWYGWGVI